MKLCRSLLTNNFCANLRCRSLNNDSMLLYLTLLLDKMPLTGVVEKIRGVENFLSICRFQPPIQDSQEQTDNIPS